MMTYVGTCMVPLSDFRKAYETAKRQLAELVAEQERLEKKKLILRKTLEALALQCQAEESADDLSAETSTLILRSSLADDIRAILKVSYPEWLRPHAVRKELENLGRDLHKYRNPQATIHMVLKRIVQAKDAEETRDPAGKQIYRAIPDSAKLLPLSVMRSTAKEAETGNQS